MSYKQMKTLPSFTTRQSIQVLKKSVTSVFLVIDHFSRHNTSSAEHTTSFRGRATTSFTSYHQLKTWSLLSKDKQSKSWEKMWAKKLKLFVIGHFSCFWNYQSRAYNFLNVCIPAD
jgi:hypothetical protein